MELPVSVLVVELRRFAPKVLDTRGIIAQQLVDAYLSVTVESGPGSLLETIGFNNESGTIRAAVSGYTATYQEATPPDSLAFEVAAQSFLKRVEKIADPVEYERLGILVGFRSSVPRSIVGRFLNSPISQHADRWQVTDGHIQFMRNDDNRGVTVDFRFLTSTNLNPGSNLADIEIQVDQWHLRPEKLHARNPKVNQAVQEARRLVADLLKEE
ncbi:MAG: hypothetical protein QM753_11880 [Thermomicrobiales bacterium]